MDDFMDGLSSQARASGTDSTSLDDRVQSLLNNLLGELMMSETVAIEIGVARQKIAEWRRDARRYSIITALAAGEYQALVKRGDQRGTSIDALLDELANDGAPDMPASRGAVPMRREDRRLNVARIDGTRIDGTRIEGTRLDDAGFEDARVEFFKRQGYWADLVGTYEDEE